MTIGQRIKAARKQVGMTQAELALKLGIPYQSIGQWERDIRNPKLETLQRIADAMEISVSELVGKDSEQRAKELLANAYNQVINAKSENDPIKKRELQMEAYATYVNAQEMAKISNSINEEERKRRMAKLIESFEKLNNVGQEKAIGYIEGLTEDKTLCVTYLTLPGVFDGINEE